MSIARRRRRWQRWMRYQDGIERLGGVTWTGGLVRALLAAHDRPTVRTWLTVGQRQRALRIR